MLSTKLLERSIGKPCVYKKTLYLNNLEEMPLLYDNYSCLTLYIIFLKADIKEKAEWKEKQPNEMNYWGLRINVT